MKTKRIEKGKMKKLHTLGLEPHDIEFAKLMLVCEKALQSGWGNWSINKCESNKTFIRTDTVGHRQVNSSYEEIVEKLSKFREKLKKKGLIAGSAGMATEVEKWLDKEFPLRR